MTITLQILSLVAKVEPVHVRFTLHLRDEWSKWMQGGCILYMDSCMASSGSCFMVTWSIFKKPPLGGRPNTKPLGDHGTPNAHNCWFIVLYCVWGPALIEIHRNSTWLRTRSHMTSRTLHLRVHDHTTWLWRCLGTAFAHFPLGSHNFMVTTFGLCVKWLLGFHSHGSWFVGKAAVIICMPCITSPNKKTLEPWGFVLHYERHNYRCPLCSCQSMSIDYTYNQHLLDFVHLLLKRGSRT